MLPAAVDEIPMTAPPVAPLSVALNVSGVEPSNRLSAETGTENVCVLPPPCVNVNVPVTGVKSAALAVLPASTVV